MGNFLHRVGKVHKKPPLKEEGDQRSWWRGCLQQKALHRFSRAGLSCFLPAYASEFFCEGTAYKLVSHAGIYSWCRIYKS